jgi:pilus assembly protein CpaB
VNVRQIAIIGGALIIAGGAFLWMRGQAASKQGGPAIVAQPTALKIQVLVAKRALSVGERLTAGALGWQDWPETGSTSVAFIVQSKTPDAIKAYENAIVRQEMVIGEPVTDRKIVVVGAETSSMAALLTPGMRATSVAITPDTSVAGFVLPNDRVDIVLTRELQVQANGQTRPRTVTSTIIENVRVLAIDQAVSAGKDQRSLAGSTATVELNATDAEKLRLADKLGDISLMLRGYTDSTGPTLARLDSPVMAQLMPEAPPPPPPEPVVTASSSVATSGQIASDVPSVKVYRGGQ